jgi:hypothetical protein
LAENFPNKEILPQKGVADIRLFRKFAASWLFFRTACWQPGGFALNKP